MKDIETIIEQANKALEKLKSNPTQENADKLNDILNKWANSRILWKQRYGLWCTYLKELSEVEDKYNLLPF